MATRNVRGFHGVKTYTDLADKVVAANPGLIGRSKLICNIWQQVSESGFCLIVGGPGGSPKRFESLDPYCPEPVTYRAFLQDESLAKKLYNRYDAVRAHAVLEHINILYLPDCVSNVFMMLKAGGLCFVEVPYIWAIHPSGRYPFGGDYVRFTLEGLERLFTEHSRAVFQTVVCEYFAIDKPPHFGIGICGLFKKVAGDT